MLFVIILVVVALTSIKVALGCDGTYITSVFFYSL